MRNADKVELRGLMDKAVVDVLEVRKAMILQRLMQGNPRIAELAGVKSEQSGE